MLSKNADAESLTLGWVSLAFSVDFAKKIAAGNPLTGLKREAAIAFAKLDLRPYFEEIKPGLTRVESRILVQADAFDPGIRGYISYAIESQGKRLRPALCLLAAEATGGAQEAHDDLAVIIELIHLASLIHDDILDCALLRRARPTLNAKWGTELAVLLGDSLFAHALKLCTRLPQTDLGRKIADAAQELCTGEILQTQRRFDLKFSIAEYMKIIEMKTAALFRVAAEGSAIINNASESSVEALRSYGRNMGLAYQVYDDCVDLFGEEDGSGKTLGTDFSKGKLTLPALHLLQQLQGNDLEELTELLLSKDSSREHEIVEKIISHGGHRVAARKAQELLDQALRGLSVLPATSHRAALEAMTQGFQKHVATLR